MAEDVHKDEFLSLPFQGLEGIKSRIAYEVHPPDGLLMSYLEGALEDKGPPQRAEELDAWLEGRRGWNLPALSLHVLTCGRCGRRMEGLRADTARERRGVERPLWQELVDVVSDVIRSRAVKRVAFASMLAALVVTLVMLFDRPEPPTQEIFFEPHEIHRAGVG